MRASRNVLLLGVLATACGGSQTKPEYGPPGPDGCQQPNYPSLPPKCPQVAVPTPPPGPTKLETVEAEPATPAVPADRPAELFAPPYTKVGVGQKVSWGTGAIDQDLDETATKVTKMPASAKWDPITQTITWTPTKADLGTAEFVVEVRQPAKGAGQGRVWKIEVTEQPQELPVAEQQSAVIETLLMIRQPKRLELVNKDWPLDKLLKVSADGFAPQFVPERRKLLKKKLSAKDAYKQFLTELAKTQNNRRLDPSAKEFDKAAFGDPKSWKIVAFRPRIDKAWTELRVVYQAVKADEPVFAMFRIRPVVEYVPATPRPEEERIANNKVFLGLVAKHLLVDGAPNEAFLADQAAHGKAVAAFMKEFMAYNEEKKAPYLRTFTIGIAMEARMGGGSARNADGTYKSGDGWAWSAQKPFQTDDGKTQAYVNVTIPGFWTKTVPTEDGKSWMPVCGDRWTKDSPGWEKGYEVLCRKTMGFVDLPDTSGPQKVKSSRIDANNMFVEHKNVLMQENFPLDDGRRDIGEENGMTCSQCHIRTFGMHDYKDLANTDPSKGAPKTRNKPIETLNFVIIPTTRWEQFTLEFLKHQECRGKQMFDEFLGPDAAKGLGCPLAK